MTIQLYHRWRCPYSVKVRDFIEANGLKERIDYIELSEAAGAEDDLNAVTGRSQVPCLVVDGEPKLESADIVSWLERNLLKS